MSTKRRIINLILVVATAALILGCTKEPEVVTQDTATVQQHVYVSNNMKRVMHDMNSVLYERHKSELERDEEKQRYALKLSDKLITISKEIKKYPQNSKQERFNNVQKKEYFMMLADQLKLHGENIRSIASSYNMKALNEEIQSMTQTCNSCHTEFNTNAPRID